jgi:ABC-type lipoprotein export system ATPase subunit
MTTAIRSSSRMAWQRSTAVDGLRGATLGFQRHAFTAVMEPSRSGKSTCTRAAGLDRPMSGSVVLDGQDLARLRESPRWCDARDSCGSRPICFASGVTLGERKS